MLEVSLHCVWPSTAHHIALLADTEHTPVQSLLSGRHCPVQPFNLQASDKNRMTLPSNLRETTHSLTHSSPK